MTERYLRLSGLEPFVLTPDIPFVNVGERTNVTGSARFRKLIVNRDYAAALDVARDQVENGAQIIDVNMDEGLIDSRQAMIEFLNLIASEPDIARVPIMIDSSKWEVIEAGLQCVQGKPVVNSISLKEGEDAFRHHAGLCLAYGAAVVVMAFDEDGQADTCARKTESCARAYRILVEEMGFPPEDIIFDPNIFAVATGIEEHDNYGVDFIEAVREIKEICPWAKISGGVSNLSFGFRGVNVIREFPFRGIRIFGARTLADQSSEWKYVNVKRFLIFVEESLQQGLMRAVFEPHDAFTRESLKMQLSSFLLTQWRDGALVGGTPEENAVAFRALLDGAPGAYRDAVLLNAAAALKVAGHASDLKDGVAQAQTSIDSGAAKAKIKAVAEITQEAA